MLVSFALPDSDRLVADVCDALQEVSAGVIWIGKNPTVAICSALRQRLDRYEGGLESAFDRDALKHEDEREFLYDFCSVLCEEKNRELERYTVQVAIAGEIEWGSNLSKDFEKLMFVDALVCFFVFPNWLREHQPNDLDFYTALAKRRVEYVASRGTRPPPVFVIAAYSGELRQFQTHVIRA